MRTVRHVVFILLAVPRRRRFCWRTARRRVGPFAQVALFVRLRRALRRRVPARPLFFVLVSYMPLAVLASASHTKSSPLLLQADQRATTQHLTAAAHTTMASKRAKNAAKLKKLGAKAVEVLRPVLYYGFLPTVILIGMRTEPRPSLGDLFTLT